MKHPLVEAVEYWCFAFLLWLARLLSFRMAHNVGGTLGGVGYYVIAARRKVALDNLTHAFPELSDIQRRRIARAAFRNYGIALVEMLWAGGQSAGELRKVAHLANPEVVERHLGGAHGLIILSGHFGNWEFIIHPVRLLIGQPFVIIVQRQRNRRIDSMIDASRTKWDNITIPMGVSSRQAFRTLREGGIVAMLGDQSGPKEAVFIDFFGRPAATHRGAAAFSLKTGAPIVMVFLMRQENGSYEAVFEEVSKAGIEAYTEENVVELTRRHTAILEKHIRQHPDHWLWMHKRWKHTGSYQSRETIAQEA